MNILLYKQENIYNYLLYNVKEKGVVDIISNYIYNNDKLEKDITERKRPEYYCITNICHENLTQYSIEKFGIFLGDNNKIYFERGYKIKENVFEYYNFIGHYIKPYYEYYKNYNLLDGKYDSIYPFRDKKIKKYTMYKNENGKIEKKYFNPYNTYVVYDFDDIE